MSPASPPPIDQARRMIAAAQDGAALSALANDWRAACRMEDLLNLAQALWSNGSEAERIAAAKLLTKARIAEDASVWAALCGWAETLDAAAALPALSAAGARRVVAFPQRLEAIDGWTRAANPLTRAASLGFAQGLAKDRHPAPAIADARTRAAEWAVALAADADAAPRRAAAEFLILLARHDAKTVARLIESKDALPQALIERLKRVARL